MRTEVDGAELRGPERQQFVRELFDRIAGPYDRLNRIISLGRDRAWRHQLLELGRIRAGDRVCDIGTGTGDIYILLAERVGPTGQVAGVDLSPGMLEHARTKAHAVMPDRQHDLTVGTADDTGQEKSTVDAVTMGWVLRNVGDRQAAYREVLRVLKPGGRLVVIDMSRPDFAPFRMASWIYMNLIMPVVIRVVGGDIEAYRYLAKSTARFPRKRELAREWEAAGFVGVACHSRMMGSIAIHIGEAPEKEN